MSNSANKSQNINPSCAACGDHKYFGTLKNGMCSQCWGYSILCNSIGFAKRMFKQGDKL